MFLKILSASTFMLQRAADEYTSQFPGGLTQAQLDAKFNALLKRYQVAAGMTYFAVVKCGADLSGPLYVLHPRTIDPYRLLEDTRKVLDLIERGEAYLVDISKTGSATIHGMLDGVNLTEDNALKSTGGLVEDPYSIYYATPPNSDNITIALPKLGGAFFQEDYAVSKLTDIGMVWNGAQDAGSTADTWVMKIQLLRLAGNFVDGSYFKLWRGYPVHFTIDGADLGDADSSTLTAVGDNSGDNTSYTSPTWVFLRRNQTTLKSISVSLKASAGSALFTDDYIMQNVQPVVITTAFAKVANPYADGFDYWEGTLSLDAFTQTETINFASVAPPPR